MLEPLETIRRQLQHQAWADARVLQSLERSAGRPPRALELFAHVLAAQHVWLRRIEGGAPELAVWPSLDLAACRAWTERSGADLERFAGRLDDEGFAGAVRYRNSAGDEYASTVADILEHLVLHSAYHRGQVAMLLRDAGFEPAPTDFIALRRGAAAATRR